MSMTSPIQAHISSVFVHVTDLKRSTEWYSRLLGLPIKPERVNGGPIYWFDLDQQTGLILDDNRNNPKDETHPLFMLKTRNTLKAYEYVQQQGIRIVKEYYEDEAVSFFNFADFDGNVLMVCGPGRGQQEYENVQDSPTGAAGASSSPIKSKITNVFVNVTDLKRATEWYNHLLQLPIKPEEEQFIYEIIMAQGANLLLDVNRYVQKQDYKTLFMFETHDLAAAHDFLIENNISIFTPMERYETVSFLTFKDPDGNVLMVCQRTGA